MPHLKYTSHSIMEILPSWLVSILAISVLASGATCVPEVIRAIVLRHGLCLLHGL